jgi:hypothetical protein
VGSIKNWGNKIVLSPVGLRWREPAATVNYRRVLSPERNPVPGSITGPPCSGGGGL